MRVPEGRGRARGGLLQWRVPRCRPDGTAEVGLGREEEILDPSQLRGSSRGTSPVPLDVLPNRRLCERVEAHPLPLAIGGDRLELLVAEDGDDSVQGNPVNGRGFQRI